MGCAIPPIAYLSPAEIVPNPMFAKTEEIYPVILAGALALASALASEMAMAVESLPEPFDSAQIAFFETEIRPVLVRSCLECHTGVDAKSGLQLNSRSGWLRGSDYRKIRRIVFSSMQ